MESMATLCVPTEDGRGLHLKPAAVHTISRFFAFLAGTVVIGESLKMKPPRVPEKLAPAIKEDNLRCCSRL